MVRSAVSLRVPMYRHFTPYLCAAVLLFGKQTDFFLPSFLLTLLLLAYSYGFNNKNLWPSEEKGLSAYSVFNENQEELLGTLNAGRIDRELRGGGIAQAPHAAAAAAAQHKRPAQHSWGKGNKLS
jgi:hypothetical protein